MNANRDLSNESDPAADGEVSDPSDDPRIIAAMQQYLCDIEAGRRRNRRELLARYPDIATELSACLQSLAFINDAIPRMPVEGGEFSPDAALDAPHQALGDFQLIREIGRGGMGVVYEAIQLSLGRSVAVKILPFAASLDQRHLQRFKNEAQAAAQLHHTNIVPVYSVGCERSVHFYAMQLIRGQSLAEIIRDLLCATGRSTEAFNKTSPTLAVPKESDRTVALPVTPLNDSSSKFSSRDFSSSNRISDLASFEGSLSSLHSRKRSSYFRSVAQLALQAAGALEYAHSLGVVHRDIKPANLLIDVRGNLWITDFGLAQVYGDNGLTFTGDLLGTYRYMSPEQASGRGAVLDQRTDIYSLGITIYELLTLERALPGVTREELLYQISYVDPRPPRSLDKTIPIELQTILAKATAKDAAERYQTARALADDLERFLRDEPIHAKPPSIWDKAVKWTRRHKSVACSAILMLLLIAGGLLISTILIAKEQTKTKAAYVQERLRAIEAAEQRAFAEKSFRQARGAVDLLTQVAADELPNDPSVIVGRRKLLEGALSYYQSFTAEPNHGEWADAELAAARSHASALLAELGATDEMYRLFFDMQLLSNDSIRSELGLSSEQIARINELSPPSETEKMASPFELIKFLSRQKPGEVIKTANDTRIKLMSIFRPDQWVRLQQLSRQCRGILAFEDPDVADALALTPAQSQTLRTIRMGLLVRFHERPPGSVPRNSSHGDENMGFPRDEESMKSILTQLTPLQLETWKNLLGPPAKTTDALDRIFRPPS